MIIIIYFNPSREMQTVDLISTLSENTIPLYGGLGYVKLVDMMPRIVPEGRTAEIAIARNARTSYNVSTDKTQADDDKLVNFLIKHHHTSPLESISFQFEIELPIFVERQLIRHRTAKVNEQSMRYTKAEDKFYLPSLRMQSKQNKQCSNSDPVSQENIDLWVSVIGDISDLYQKYLTLVNAGVAREVARCCLPVALMTKVMWNMDLHNLRNFLRLRTAPDAQLEIRELAEGIAKLISPLVPVSISTLTEQ
jgi:thymidylate synthase (FAD)